MEVDDLLETIVKKYEVELGDNFVGFYVHGSFATQSFNWNKSDIDFIVVVKNEINLDNKINLIRVLLDLDQEAPSKGFEMSVVLEEVCHNIIYPTPYLLHYSNYFKQNYIEDIKNTCDYSRGLDKDLATHFKMIKSVGKCIKGKPINEVFNDVPEKMFLDSIMNDIQNYESEIIANPIYSVLNLVRTLAYLNEDVILSKSEAGIWGVVNIKEYSKLIEDTAHCYCDNEELSVDEIELIDFAKVMLNRINLLIENGGCLCLEK